MPDQLFPPQAYQHLQVQLRSHPHVELHVQVMVVRDKGPGCGTSRDHVHHGSLHLYKGLSSHKIAGLKD